MVDLKGKTALVTGASRGFGQAVAVALGAAGAKVIATARTVGGLEETDDMIRAAGGSAATLLTLDLTQPALLDTLPQHLMARFGGLDVLVANAGYLGELSPLAQCRLDQFEKIFTTNVTANAALIQALDPLLRRSRSSRAVFVSCARAVEPKPFWGAYGASKAALEHLVSTYAQEAKMTKVRVNIYDPGPLPTELRKAAMPGEDRSLLADPSEPAKHLVSRLYDETVLNGQRMAFV